MRGQSVKSFTRSIVSVPADFLDPTFCISGHTRAGWTIEWKCQDSVSWPGFELHVVPWQTFFKNHLLKSQPHQCGQTTKWLIHTKQHAHCYAVQTVKAKMHIHDYVQNAYWKLIHTLDLISEDNDGNFGILEALVHYWHIFPNRYTQLHKKRTTYVNLLMSKISIGHNHVIYQYIALKFRVLISNLLNMLASFFFKFPKLCFRDCKKRISRPNHRIS